MRKFVAFVLLIAGLNGCAAVQDCHYETANSLRTEWAWRTLPRTETARAIASPIFGVPQDYRAGWKEGYYGVMTGGSGRPPFLPPQKYWSAHYQNPRGQQAVALWYQGFNDGARLAEETGAGRFHYLRPYGQPQLPMAAPAGEPPSAEFIAPPPPSPPLARQPAATKPEREAPAPPELANQIDRPTLVARQLSQPQPAPLESPAQPTAAQPVAAQPVAAQPDSDPVAPPPSAGPPVSAPPRLAPPPAPPAVAQQPTEKAELPPAPPALPSSRRLLRQPASMERATVQPASVEPAPDPPPSPRTFPELSFDADDFLPERLPSVSPPPPNPPSPPAAIVPSGLRPGPPPRMSVHP